MMNRKPSSARESILPINLNSARIADVDAPVCPSYNNTQLVWEV